MKRPLYFNTLDGLRFHAYGPQVKNIPHLFAVEPER